MTETENTYSIKQALEICINLYNQGNFDKSIEVANQILQKDPKNVDAKYCLAISLINKGNYDLSEKLLKECIEVAPNHVDLYFQMGKIKKENEQINSAIYYYENVLKLNPDHIGAINNVANIYNDIGDSKKALEYFNHLIKVGGERSFVYSNMSLIYKKNGLLQDALSHALKAIALDPNCIEAYCNAAGILILTARNKDAIICYKKVLELAPNNLNNLQEYHKILQKICDWDTRKSLGKRIDQLRAEKNLKNINAENIDYNEREFLHERNDSARKIVADQTANIRSKYPVFTIDTKRKDKNKQKLRIGYISSDICDHPVSQLMRGVFKNHSKTNFETYLYSFSKVDKSGYKETIQSYVDKFIDINRLSNIETANLIYNDEIDVLIDLNGHTGSTRLGALSLKPAPVIVNYIGYIGTMGADFIDYIITDQIVTPPSQQQYYDEKFVYMPDCYQANDNDLKISEEIITKADEGLPEDKFIFCSMNQAYKIDPIMFEVWMNILKRVDNSVLWLYKGSIYNEDNLAVENLSNEAKKRGVDPNRLIFAKAVAPIEKHLKRTLLADLALDTRLYNGGTVTSQTLWAGVPVVTLQGESFESRMASSILTSLGLNELVTTNKKDYEDLAVTIATEKKYFEELKIKLQKNKTMKPLFDTEKFTLNLEKAYRKMWENYCDGNAVVQMHIEN